MSARTCTGGDSNGGSSGSSYSGTEMAVGPLHHRERCITSHFVSPSLLIRVRARVNVLLGSG